MPIYEYQCSACEHQMETIQKFSDEALKDCPECGKAALQKLISNSAFHLKGGGWYVTDIRDKDKKKPETPSSEIPKESPKESGPTGGSSTTGSSTG